VFAPASGLVTLMVSTPVSEPKLFEAVTTTAKEPVLVGTPVISPVAANFKPAGRPVALNVGDPVLARVVGV